MNDVTRIFKELGYTVIATPGEYAVEYQIYEIIGEHEDGSVAYRPLGDEGDNSTSDLGKATLFAHGDVKWDGCSNWSFDEQDEIMLHRCDRTDLTNIGAILEACWDMTAELCKNWSPA